MTAAETRATKRSAENSIQIDVAWAIWQAPKRIRGADVDEHLTFTPLRFVGHVLKRGSTCDAPPGDFIRNFPSLCSSTGPLQLLFGTKSAQGECRARTTERSVRLTQSQSCYLTL